MIAVTGSAGFIGRHVVEALGRWDTITLDRKSGCELTAMPADALRGVDTVIHLAARADISQNWSGGERAGLYADNIDALLAILDECAATKTVRRFVFASTCAIYGDTPVGVIRTEADPPLIQSPYAATKLAGEAFVQAYAHRFDWEWHCARLVSCVGAGYTHGHISDFVEKARANDGRIEALDHGRSRKSFLHVRDAADALVSMSSGAVPSGVYNVSSSTRWGWRDTARMMGVEPDASWCDRGWVGDPVGLTVSGERLAPWFRPGRSVAAGVSEALHSLGWTSPRPLS